MEPTVDMVKRRIEVVNKAIKRKEELVGESEAVIADFQAKNTDKR